MSPITEPLVLMDVRHKMLLDDYCERRVNELRRMNDQPSSDETTSFIRGRIAELKQLQSYIMDRSSIQTAAAPGKFA